MRNSPVNMVQVARHLGVSKMWQRRRRKESDGEKMVMKLSDEQTSKPQGGSRTWMEDGREDRRKMDVGEKKKMGEMGGRGGYLYPETGD